MSIVDSEFEDLKKFVGLFYDLYMVKPHHRAESHPLAVIERLEGKSRSQTMRGLEMALNDCVEMTSEWSPDAVATADRRFLAAGRWSLTQVRARYSKDFLRVLKRGNIKSMKEYYLVKGIVDGGGILPGASETERLASMLDDYESRVFPKSAT